MTRPLARREKAGGARARAVPCPPRCATAGPGRGARAAPGPARPRARRLVVRLLAFGALGGAGLAAAGLPGPGAAAQALAQSPAPPAAAAARGRVVADTLWSPALGTRKQFLVYLPPSYDRAPDRRYPVAYYLHGLWGRETDWARHGRLADVADSLAAGGGPELVLVMPDGDDSWYTTWNALGTADACRADTARREPAASYCVPWARYDDYLARDLVARVDSAYRTRPGRAHRGVAGLSMGGYGAVTLALRYPDVFAAAVSHSGVLAPLLAGPRPYAPPARWAPSVDSLRALYGRYWTTLPLAMGRDTAAWWARDPARLLARARAAAPRAAPVPALRADVGTADLLVSQNRAFRDAARALGVPLAYAEWPGGHTWAYWRAHAGEGLAWLAARLGAPGAPPAPREAGR
jgi:S-formylglutathione hydrolase FrmB